MINVIFWLINFLVDQFFGLTILSFCKSQIINSCVWSANRFLPLHFSRRKSCFINNLGHVWRKYIFRNVLNKTLALWFWNYSRFGRIYYICLQCSLCYWCSVVIDNTLLWDILAESCLLSKIVQKLLSGLNRLLSSCSLTNIHAGCIKKNKIGVLLYGSSNKLFL